MADIGNGELKKVQIALAENTIELKNNNRRLDDVIRRFEAAEKPGDGKICQLDRERLKTVEDEQRKTRWTAVGISGGTTTIFMGLKELLLKLMMGDS